VAAFSHLLSLEFIKHLKNYTDEELIDQFHFNYQVSYAVGQRCLGELQLGLRTLVSTSNIPLKTEAPGMKVYMRTGA
jgi:hypothetical protein